MSLNLLIEDESDPVVWRGPVIAGTVKQFWTDVVWGDLDILFIENVGNLVCPAEFDLGEDAKVTLLSVTEGDDKPEKYPLMFHIAKAMVLNKVDLLPYVDFDMDKAQGHARKLNEALDIFPVSCRTGEGLQAWYDWLRCERAAKL